MVEAISRLRKDAGSGASLTVWKVVWVVGLQVLGATLHVGSYARSVREASASRAPRCTGKLQEVGLCSLKLGC